MSPRPPGGGVRPASGTTRRPRPDMPHRTSTRRAHRCQRLHVCRGSPRRRPSHSPDAPEGTARDVAQHRLGRYAIRCWRPELHGCSRRSRQVSAGDDAPDAPATGSGHSRSPDESGRNGGAPWGDPVPSRHQASRASVVLGRTVLTHRNPDTQQDRSPSAARGPKAPSADGALMNRRWQTGRRMLWALGLVHGRCEPSEI